jgi:SAM-dependent methyltransferase
VTEQVSRLADPAYVRFQYADDQKLRVRIETHQRYSENPVPFTTWILGHVDARAGQRLLDVGSGPGQYHDKLAGVRVIALDTSAGMLAKVKVPAVRADAQALPFAAGSFDRVMANHVIYHVPDMTLALRELRRVSRPGARVVMAANSRTSMRPLFALVDEVAAEVGIPGYPSVGLRFALEDLPLVQQAFGTARVEIYEDAFRFPSAEPVLAYVGSMWVDLLDPATRAAFLRGIEARVRAIIERDGPCRVPKRSGCFVADA